MRLSKSTRDALREALADAEVYVTQIPDTCEEEHLEAVFQYHPHPRRHASQI